MNLVTSASSFPDGRLRSDEPVTIVDTFLSGVEVEAPAVRLYSATGCVTIRAPKVFIHDSRLEIIRLEGQRFSISDSLFEKIEAEGETLTLERAHGYTVKAATQLLRARDSWLGEVRTKHLRLAVLDDTAIKLFVEDETRDGGAYATAFNTAIGITDLPLVDAGTTRYGRRINVFDSPTVNHAPADDLYDALQGTPACWVTAGFEKALLEEARERWADDPEILEMLEAALKILEFRRQLRS